MLLTTRYSLPSRSVCSSSLLPHCTHVGSYHPDQGSNLCPCIGRWHPNHWATREVLSLATFFFPQEPGCRSIQDPRGVESRAGKETWFPSTALHPDCHASASGCHLS